MENIFKELVQGFILGCILAFTIAPILIAKSKNTRLLFSFVTLAIVILFSINYGLTIANILVATLCVIIGNVRQTLEPIVIKLVNIFQKRFKKS